MVGFKLHIRFLTQLTSLCPNMVMFQSYNLIRLHFCRWSILSNQISHLPVWRLQWISFQISRPASNGREDGITIGIWNIQSIQGFLTTAFQFFYETFNLCKPNGLQDVDKSAVCRWKHILIANVPYTLNFWFDISHLDVKFSKNHCSSFLYRWVIM